MNADPPLHWAVSASPDPLQSVLSDSSRDWCVSHYVHHVRYVSLTPGWNIFFPRSPKALTEIFVWSFFFFSCSRLIYLQMRSPALTSTFIPGGLLWRESPVFMRVFQMFALTWQDMLSVWILLFIIVWMMSIVFWWSVRILLYKCLLCERLNRE